MRLILPDTKYLASYAQALREGYYLGIAPTVPEDEIQKIEADPHPYFEKMNGQGGMLTPEDGIERPCVPFNTFWLIDNEEFIGGVNIRMQLNDFLEFNAGHMGYGIRPSKRRLGYAKKIIHLGLQKLAAKGVTQAVITADEANTGSWRAIEANGGVLADTRPSIFHPGSPSRRYFIDLTKMGPMP